MRELCCNRSVCDPAHRGQRPRIAAKAASAHLSLAAPQVELLYDDLESRAH